MARRSVPDYPPPSHERIVALCIAMTTVRAMTTSEMAPRYNVFWYDPESCWAATIDQAPGVICYGDGPQEALKALEDAIDHARFDDVADGRMGEWCAVCWTSAEACEANVKKARDLEKHAGFLESVGVLPDHWYLEDVLDGTVQQ